MKIYLIIFLTILTFGISCKQDRKITANINTTVPDLKGKFEVELPSSWHKEFNTSDISSGIISSDTTVDMNEVMVINATWNAGTVFINSHLENVLDSLNETVGLKTKMSKTGKINEYRTCFNFSFGLDSLNEINRNQLLYVLKSDSIGGHILFTAIVYGDSIQESQSELIAEIVKSIEMKK